MALLRYVLTRFAIWIPSVLVVMLAVYALAFYGAGDPIKLTAVGKLTCTV